VNTALSCNTYTNFEGVQLRVPANQVIPFYIKKLIDATADFKNYSKVGVPQFGPNPSFKGTISKTFFMRMSL
jgi:hypothetical protein